MKKLPGDEKIKIFICCFTSTIIMLKHTSKYTKKLRCKLHKFRVDQAVKILRYSILSSPILRVRIHNKCKQISSQTGLNPKTIESEYKKRYQAKKKPIRNLRFTTEFERSLAVYVSEMSKCSVQYSKIDIIKLVSGMISGRNFQLSYKWINGWIKRNADLVKESNINFIEHTRKDESLQSHCEAFYSLLNEYRSLIHFHPDIIINADEN